MIPKLRKNIITGIFLALSFFIPTVSYSEGNNSTFKNSGQESKVNGLDLNYLNKKSEDFYIIGPGDRLGISVSDDYPELVSQTKVSGEGTIFLPALGIQYVENLTIKELEILLNDSYKKYVKFPSVNIQMVAYRPVKVFVDGEVNNPGLYTLLGERKVSEFQEDKSLDFLEFDAVSVKPSDSVSDLTDTLDFDDQQSSLTFFFPTLFDALRSSGGITRYSDLSNIKVVRKNSISKGGGKIETNLNFEEILTRVDNSQNIRIKDGDMIFVKKLPNNRENLINEAIKSTLNPKFIKVFVSGRIKSPGVITLGKSSVLNDAIAMTGGTRVLKGKLSYLTFNNDGSVNTREINYRKKNKRGSKNNPYLKNGDLIYVGNTLLTNSGEVIGEVTAPFQGLYSAYRLFELISE